MDYDAFNVKPKGGKWFDVLLVLLILVGIGFRFYRTDWHQGANLHPDEYGLTNTLTQLRLPDNLADYLNTRVSPISPYNKYDENGQHTGDGPDNRMRWGQWPIILLRAGGELTGNTGYDEIRMFGRRFSAVLDILSIAVLFLIGKRLYGARIGLMAAAFSSLAVMQIQQSHFMTVDNFGVFFTVVAMYAAVRMAERPCTTRQGADYVWAKNAWPWYALFGIAFGMAMATKINLLPLGGMMLVAAFISAADLRLRSQRDMSRIVVFSLAHLALAGLVALFVFRVTQPMSFREPTGDTGLFSLSFNPDWTESMAVAQSESNGIGGGPPSEQWANRPAILFPLMNMVFWGMGLGLGVTAWLGFLWAAWRTFRQGQNWRAHLLPLVWVGGYFLFMGTRWVKSIRYFLPIYPFLALLAAWGLWTLWQQLNPEGSEFSTAQRWLRRLAPAVLIGGVLGSTLWYAFGFVQAVYVQDHTRVQAVRWIYQNIPSPFQLNLQSSQGEEVVLLGGPEDVLIMPEEPFIEPFTVKKAGVLGKVKIGHFATLVPTAGGNGALVKITLDPEGLQVIGRAELKLPDGGTPDFTTVEGQFDQGNLETDRTYFLNVTVQGGQAARLRRSILANESWDEGLPFPFDNYDPFGQLYQGLTMETRWPDAQNKREMFLTTLAKTDYIIVPSQRSIWSAPRIPLTYPMTLEYYRALFDGRLGFELAASFNSPMQFGPLSVSDVGGTFALGKKAELPLFNLNPLAAEEAFSVYDHPPVWIFRKRADFSLEKAAAVLGTIDLNKVVVQGPREATPLEVK